MALFNLKSSSSPLSLSQSPHHLPSFLRYNYIGIAQQQQRCGCCCVVENPVMVMVASSLKCKSRQKYFTGHRRLTNSYFPSLSPSTPNAAMEAADAVYFENVSDFERGTSTPHENNTRDDEKARRGKALGYSTVRRGSPKKQSFARLEKLDDSDSVDFILQTDTDYENERVSRDLQTSFVSSKETSRELPYKELKKDLDGDYIKLDASGRLRTPRAARELSLCILYAAISSKMPPVRVFENRITRHKDFTFGCVKDILQDYSLSPNIGQAIFVEDEASATKLESEQEQEATTEAAVLTAPLSMVYNKFVLSMARKIIKAASDMWLLQDPIVNQLFPVKWKEEKGRMIEKCILHMAIAEIESVGTTPSIVIDEAVELTKRYCDGVAPRVINGCLGSYCRSRQLLNNVSPIARELETSQALSFSVDLPWNEDSL